MMKTVRFLLIASVAMILLFLPSCDSDSFKVTEELERALSDRYPDASYLEWKKIDGYYVAEFRNEGFYCKAWFDKHNQWVMTESSDLIYDKNLSEYIRTDFQNRYERRNIEDIYRVEFSTIETRYIIQVDQSDKDVYLFYLDNGVLLKEETGTWSNRPIIFSDKILNFLNTEEDISSIVDAEFGYYVIRLYDKNAKIICFDLSENWQMTYWTITRSEAQKNEIVENELSKLLASTNNTIVDITTIYKIHHKDYIPYVYAYEINHGERIIFIREDGEQVNLDIKFLT